MTKQMEPNIGIALSDRNTVAGMLNVLLADEYVLYTKTRNYHWNVTGSNFNELHRVFEVQYETLDQSIDEIAERVRSLGAHTVATLAEFSAITRLQEQPGKHPEAREMLEGLLADQETTIRNLRTDVDLCSEKHRDAGTADFLTGLMEGHEKMA